MYRILVTNDDGVYASGLKAAAQGVNGLGEVFVVAPSGQMSGVGRSISVFEPLRFAEVNMDGQKAYAVTGTPTDSVIIGIFAGISFPLILKSGGRPTFRCRSDALYLTNAFTKYIMVHGRAGVSGVSLMLPLGVPMRA